MSDPAPVREIAIVGMAPAGREIVGRMSPEVEIWSLNAGPLAFLGDRWDRHYEVHEFGWLEGRPGLREQGYLDWLQKDHGKPVYVPKLDARVPSGVEIPVDALIETFGTRLPDGRGLIYWQSTVDWMLTHAIWELLQDAEAEGRKATGKIHVLGVDMAMGEEYAHQRPSCEHWLGVALGLGLEVMVPPQADIMKIRFVYGLDTYEPVAKKIQQRRRELEAELNGACAAEATARDRKMALRGALDDLTWHEQARY